MSARCEVCGSLRDASPREAAGPCRRCGGRLARPELLGPAKRGGPIGEFSTGLSLALRGVRMTLLTPRMLALVVLPLLANVALFAWLAWVLYGLRGSILPGWATTHLGAITDVVSAVFAIALAALAAWLLSSVVNAPFLEWLSESTETRVFGHGDDRPITLHYVWNVWIVPLLQALGLALMQGVLGLLLLLASLTGVLAPLVFVGAAWMVAITLCDVVVARKRYPIRARLRLVNRSWALHLGVALPFAFAPILLPLGVAGATLAYLRDRRLLGGLPDR